MREAKTLAKFRHPNIVRVFRVFEANQTAYIVLEFVKGADLERWLTRLGRLPTQPELDELIAPLLDALEAVHKTGILHRDIKPANIYIREMDQKPVLIDFGAARYALGEGAGTTAAIVSKGYSPHEAYATDGRSQGPWTDIYGLAATAYRAVSGGPPPEATGRILSDDIVPACALPAACKIYEPDFLTAIDAGLALMPNARPQSVAEWRLQMFPNLAANTNTEGKSTSKPRLSVSGAESGSNAVSTPSGAATADSAPARGSLPRSSKPSIGKAVAAFARGPTSAAESIPAQAAKHHVTLAVGLLLILGGAAGLIAVQTELTGLRSDGSVGTDHAQAEAERQQAAEAARQKQPRRRPAEAEAERKQAAEAARQKEAEEKARAEAEAERKQAAEAARQKEAEEKARAEAEAERKQAAEAARQKEAEEKARAEAEAERQQAAEAARQKEAEEKARAEAEAERKQAAEAARQKEAEEKARAEAEAERKQAAEAARQKEAEEKARAEAEAERQQAAEAAKQQEAAPTQQAAIDPRLQVPTEEQRTDYVKQVQTALKGYKCYNGKINGDPNDARSGLKRFETSYDDGTVRQINLDTATVGEYQDWLNWSNSLSRFSCPNEKPRIDRDTTPERKKLQTPKDEPRETKKSARPTRKEARSAPIENPVRGSKDRTPPVGVGGHRLRHHGRCRVLRSVHISFRLSRREASC